MLIKIKKVEKKKSKHIGGEEASDCSLPKA